MGKITLILLIFSCNFAKAQWFQIEEPDPEDLCFRAIQFPVEDTGFVVNHLGIGKTVDGGESWVYTNIEGSFSKVDFIGVDTGIVCCGITGGENLIRTYNGGETWQFPTQFFIVAQDVELLENGDIFFVENTGDVLLHHFTDFYNNYEDSELWQGYGNDIVFPNENSGYIAGYIDKFDSASVVVRTFDGGYNWFNTLAIADGPETEISFPSPAIGYGRSHYPNRIWKSIDFGNTWELLPFEFRPDLDPTQVSIVKIYFFNDTVGYVAVQTIPEPFVYHYQIFRTTDGAVTWDLTSFSEDDIGPTDIFCTDPFECYMTTCGGGIYKTTNGGIIDTGQVAISNILTMDITIYPNPTSGIILVEGISNALDAPDITNLFGQKINYKILSLEETKIIIDLTNLPCGIYYISNNKNLPKKILKL